LKRSVALVLSCALLPAAARAQSDAPLTVSLTYEGPTECPDALGFETQVRGRTARVRFVEPGQPSEVGWSVVIRQAKNGTSGTLHVSGAAQGKLTRKVTAATCEQVVSALALGAALSVDPDASLVLQPDPEPPPPPATPQAEPAKAAEPAGTPTKPRAATRLALGLSLTARSGMGPELSWAPRAFIGLSYQSRSGHTWGLRLSGTQVHASATSSVGQADFTWNVGRIEAFPVRFGSSPWRFEPAVLFEAGQLRARGVAVSPVNQVERPVLFGGALGRLSLLAFDLLLLELEGGLAVPFLRDRFYLHENTTVFHVPAAAGFAAAGVGLEFL
jgi:hypothetical protein